MEWVNFDIKYEGHHNCSKTLSMPILRVFGDHHMWCQNRHQYVWTSLCQLIFLWTSSIVYVFDFLTFDIFLTIWHLFDNLTSFWHFDIFFNLNHLSPWLFYVFHVLNVTYNIIAFIVEIVDTTTEKTWKDPIYRYQRLQITLYILIQTHAKSLNKQLLWISASINRRIQFKWPSIFKLETL